MTVISLSETLQVWNEAGLMRIVCTRPFSNSFRDNLFTHIQTQCRVNSFILNLTRGGNSFI